MSNESEVTPVEEKTTESKEENINEYGSIKKLEEEIEQTEESNTSQIKLEVEEGQSHIEKASCSNLDELEIQFANRYTENNTEYMKLSKGFDPVIIVHPWASRTKRVYDYSRGNRGGWRGGRGNRGNYWRGRDDYRGHGYHGKRHMNDNGSGYRGNNRVHYPGHR